MLLKSFLPSKRETYQKLSGHRWTKKTDHNLLPEAQQRVSLRTSVSNEDCENFEALNKWPQSLDEKAFEFLSSLEFEHYRWSLFIGSRHWFICTPFHKNEEVILFRLVMICRGFSLEVCFLIDLGVWETSLCTVSTNKTRKIDALLKEELLKMNELQWTHVCANERFSRKAGKTSYFVKQRQD